MFSNLFSYSREERKVLPLTGLCLALILLFAGCDAATAPVETPKDRYSARIAEDLTPPSSLPGSNVTDFDSLREVLLEVILPTPDERVLEIWYAKRSEWVPQVGNWENLQTYIEYIFKEQVKAGDLSTAAFMKLAKGRIFIHDAGYTEAVDQFQEALELSATAGDSVVAGWAYLGLASSLLRLKDYEGAEENVNRAFAIARQQKNKRLETLAKFAQSGVHLYTGRMETAERILKEMIQEADELHLYELKKLGLLNLSYCHIVVKKFDEAIGLLTSNPILTQGEASLVTVFRNLNLYEAYEGKKEYDKAYGYLIQGGRDSEILDYAFGRSFCKQSMAKHYERKGQYKLALEIFQEYHEINEKQTGEDARKKLQAMKIEKEYQEKDWEIERLTSAEEERALAYKIRRNVTVASFIGLALTFLFFYFLLRYKARTDHANQNKEIAETRLQVLQAQINPHFIFNALTGIQNSVLKSETIQAYNYLGKFSDILRVIATTATSISITLDKEVGLIENYLALEKLRFRDGFVYSVDVSPSLVNTNFKVPGMLVQPVVENAIVHGISNLDYQGEITVFFQEFRNGIKVVVSDNGRGRRAAYDIKKKEKGRHLSIASENATKSLKALRAIGYKDADIQTLDLFNKDGTSAGTQVTIYLPFLESTKNT